MIQFVTLRKSGGSYVVSVPKPVCDALRIGPGDQLALTIEGKRIIVAKFDELERALDDELRNRTKS